MAAFEAIERLQKFDWLIQKLHSLRTSLQSEPGLTELQQLHALQLLQRNAGFNGSSLGDAEEEIAGAEPTSSLPESEVCIKNSFSTLRAH